MNHDAAVREARGSVNGLTPEGECGHGHKVGACPIHDPVEPTVEQTPSSPMHEEVERHPSYGMIGAARVSGDAYLFGSDFRHQHFITVSIRRAERFRGLSRDWTAGREELIEVAMSEAQWASFVSSLNVGHGVECTIEAIDNKSVSRLPRPRKKTAKFAQEIRDRMADARRALAELRARIESGKGGKEAQRMIDRVEAQIGSSLTFVADQFGEYMEDTIEQAKAEVNAYAQATMVRAGLLERPPISIGPAEEKR